MATDQDAGRRAPPAGMPPAPGDRDLRLAWWATGTAFVVVLAAAVWGPGPGDPLIWLIGEVVGIVVLGLGAASAAVFFAVRAHRAGRVLALAPLILAVFFVLQALLRVVGSIGRYYQWG